MHLADRADRWLSVSSLAARVYLGYKAITLREKRLGLLIKFGQLIGSRPDLIPDEYIEVLSRLQDQVPPRPFGVIKRTVESELQRPLEDVFSQFQRTAIAAASLAQVHKATLRDGRVVAVKVQYPGIDEIVDNDLKNIRFLIRLLSIFERNLDFTPLIEEISANVPMELDFIN